MRGEAPETTRAVEIIRYLPAIYQEDLFTDQFTRAFDDVLAPVHVVLDNIEQYFNPYLTPVDFLDWLAGWVGMGLSEDWPIERKRQVVASAIYLHQWRGTVAALKAEVELYTGGYVEISETGGTAYSVTPGGEMPGEDVPRLAVRITIDDPSTINERGLDALVVAAKPAHVVHSVEIVTRGKKR